MDASALDVCRYIAEILSDFAPRSVERFESNRAGFKIQVGVGEKTASFHDTLPLRMASTPPGYDALLVMAMSYKWRRALKEAG
jgi:hypothetical protein